MQRRAELPHDLSMSSFDRDKLKAADLSFGCRNLQEFYLFRTINIVENINVEGLERRKVVAATIQNGKIWPHLLVRIHVRGDSDQDECQQHPHTRCVFSRQRMGGLHV